MVKVGMTAHYLIEALAVGGCDILDIGHVLEPSLNLKRRGTCLSQVLKQVYPTHILQREQVAVVLNDVVVSINQVELHTAELCTLTSVSRTVEAVLRGIAHATIADTQRTMNEDFKFDIGQGFVNGPYLIDGEFTRQDDTAETQVAQPPHLLERTVVGLRRGVKRQGRHLQQCHVLHQDGIDACLLPTADGCRPVHRRK